MNTFWQRAADNGVLDSIYGILRIELAAEKVRKDAESEKFKALKNNESDLLKFQKDSGLTYDICVRILAEVKRDIDAINEIPDGEERSAVYGEKKLGCLFNSPDKRQWKNRGKGCCPVDIVIVRPDNPSVLMGDCKFGLKSEEASLFKDREHYEEGFGRKFSSVDGFLMEYDGITPLPEMLVIVTSSLAPVLKNRIEDFKLDPERTSIPYDKIIVCSTDDILGVAKKYLP